MDQIVTLETAKLAEEVGYDGNFLYQYMYGDDTPTPNMMFCDEAPIEVEDLDFDAAYPGYDIAAPTQTALSRWLREKHDMYVSVDIAIFKRGWNACIISIPKELVCTNARGFDTYEEAMEEGLKLACKIVKERRSE